MRVRAEGHPGELARRPEDALGALVNLAVVDGADREEWLSKALRSAGATRRVREGTDPTYRVVDDKAERIATVYRRCLAHIAQQVETRLMDEQARIDHEARAALDVAL